MLNSPPAMNTSKIHLYMEQFSLKANGSLVENLLDNQGCNKDSHTVRSERREGTESGPMPLGAGAGRLPVLGDPPWGVSGSSQPWDWKLAG